MGKSGCRGLEIQGGYTCLPKTREHRNIIVKHWAFSKLTREQTREQICAHGHETREQGRGRSVKWVNG